MSELVQLEPRGRPQEAALIQIARIVSLDHDGESFMALGAPIRSSARSNAPIPASVPSSFTPLMRPRPGR